MTITSKPGAAEFARQFYLVSAVVFGSAGVLTWVLIRVGNRVAAWGDWAVPPVFVLTTLLLLTGSLALHRAVGHVRQERQLPFRRSLFVALFAGTLFVGVQCFGLWQIVSIRTAAEAATDAMPFVFVSVVLHGLHFILALLFVVFITLKAMAHRYDHEYFWGVIVCTYFWHLLGIAWLWIVCVLALVR